MFKLSPKVHPLTSTRLFFCEIRETDASDYFALFSDPRVFLPMGITAPKNRQEAKHQILQNSAKSMTWLLRLKNTRQFTGVFSLHDINCQHRWGQIGGAIIPELWGKDYGLEAVRSILSFGFYELVLHRIEAHLYPENIPMRKLLEKVGFRVEGQLRENYRYGSKFGDSLIMGILKTDNPT